MTKIGLFGGTLDPIHVGHLRAAEEVWEGQRLDEVWFVPASVPPHKEPGEVSPFHHRLAMVRLATGGCPHLLVSDMEGKRQGLSYSVDTLASLHQDCGAELFLILGSDAFREIETWKDYPRLTRYAHLVVLGREAKDWPACEAVMAKAFPEYREVAAGNFAAPGKGEIRWQEVTHLAVSATEIRSRCRQGRSVRFLVTEPVRAYVEENELYGLPTDKAKDQPGMRRGLRHGDRAPEGSGLKGVQGPGKADEKAESEPGSALARRVAALVSENKGEEICVLDMRDLSSLSDYFVIAHGRSTRHVQGMADKIERALREDGIRSRGIEGENEGSWVLMDYGDVLLHLFNEPVRGFYDLEGLWSEAPRLETKDLEP